MLEMTISTECGHLFVIHIEAVVKAPNIGDAIKCRICQKQTKVLSRGVPHRIQREQHPTDENQGSILGE